jgi:hypothetical protein
MRMMCLRLMKGARSGYVSVDAMRSLIVTLFILYDPYVDLWLRVGVRVTSLARRMGGWVQV